MSNYRPLYTNTQIDGQALNGAIRGIGGLFGKGKMTGVESVDANGKPTMSYSTSGGNFWDNVFGQQAQNANLAAQGLGYKTNMDVYKDKGLEGNRTVAESQRRLNEAQDKESIFQQQAQALQRGQGDLNPFVQGRSIEAMNKIETERTIQDIIRRGLLKQQMEAQMLRPGLENQGLGLQNKGRMLDNSWQRDTAPLRKLALDQGNQRLQQQMNLDAMRSPYELDLLEAQAKDIAAREAQSRRDRYANATGIPGGVLDRWNGAIIQQKVRELMGQQKLGDTVFESGTGKYTLDESPIPGARGTNKPVQISDEQMDRVLKALEKGGK